VYDPGKDRQHYCHQCKEWFDEQCLGEPVEPDDEPDDHDSIAKLRKGVPICRGSNGVEERSVDWHVVGLGRRLKKVREWIERESLPDDWEEQLGRSFVENILDGDWQFYQCPSCDLYI